MKFTFRKKLLASLLGLVGVVVFLVLWYIWSELASLPQYVFNAQLKAAVSNASLSLSADDIEAVRRSDLPKQTPAYKRLKSSLLQIAAAAPSPDPKRERVRRKVEQLPKGTNAYLLTRDNPQASLRYLIPPTDTPGELTLRPLLLDGWQEPLADEDVIETERGDIMAGAAPIKNADGQTVALLVIEVMASGLTAISNSIYVITVIVFVVSVLGASVVAIWVSGRLNRPIQALSQGMAKVAKGNVNARIDPISTGDEFETLITRFNEMVSGLAERDRMKESLRLAMDIQQHLLPQEAPSLEGFDVAGSSLYCDETGGDYYDFIDLEEIGPNKLGIAVGDITGHGIGAALLMASARGVLRSHATRHGMNLSELFEAINIHLVRDTGDERFMTLFYGVLDGPSRSLQWVSGGHDPALWRVNNTGQIEELETTGIPLGILEETQYPQPDPIILDNGDVIVVGTDGIWEARNPDDEMFGKERLRQILHQTSDRPAAEIREAIIQAVRSFLGRAHRQDDITLVVIKAV